MPQVRLTRMHLSLNTRDLARSIAFYRDLLGIEPAKVRERYAKFMPDGPPLALALNEVSRAPTGDRLSHLGIQVTSPEALEAARTRLRASGYDLREEHETTCCYAVQNKFWVTDPDGNEWEFYEFLRDAAVHSEPETPCCADSRP